MQRIMTLQDLDNARKNRKAVISLSPRIRLKPLPAAVVMNFTGEMILLRIKEGLFIYEKKENKNERR